MKVNLPEKKSHSTFLAALLVSAGLAGLGWDFSNIVRSGAFKGISHDLTGWFGLILLGGCCLAGIAAVFMDLRVTPLPPWLKERSSESARAWEKWLGVLGVILIPAIWIFTPWKDVQPGFWVALFYYGGWAVLLGFLFRTNHPRSFLSWGITALGLLVLSLSIQEIWKIPTSGVKWRYLFWGLYPIETGLAVWLVQSAQEPSYFWNPLRWLARQARRLRFIRWIVALAVFLFPSWLCLYSPWGDFFSGTAFRLVLAAGCSLLITCLIGEADDWRSLFLISGVSIYGFFVAGYLTGVTNYPFSLGWSEGNRFYDYSSIFGQDLYSGGGFSVPYFSPGRYGLWGIWFLIPGLPIWFHRLWDAVLWTVLPLIAGRLFARRLPVDARTGWGITIWAALFLNQGPIYPPLMLAAILVLLVGNSPLWLQLMGAAVASVYAGLSRFTWALAPGIWAGLMDLFRAYPSRKGNWLQRLFPTLLLAIAGILPGALISWMPVLTNTQTGFLTKQPFLWYRLWPNTTFAPGIALGLLLAAGPLLLILSWMTAKRWMRLDVWQAIAVGGSLLGFLAIGLAASVKIGGGSNLHNLDMFLFTVLLISGAGGYRLLQLRKENPLQLPGWIRLMMILVALIPAWNALTGSSPLHLPDEKTVKRDIQTIQSRVDEAKKRGEVLFIDQRQLLTFGIIKNVRLVPDYEKKYMMDQAMGNNQEYFEQFRKDLASHRFSLIVSETLKVNYSEGDHNFNEENDAWVKYVSETVLKYYRPVETLKEYTGIQLLIPIE